MINNTRKIKILTYSKKNNIYFKKECRYIECNKNLFTFKIIVKKSYKIQSSCNMADRIVILKTNYRIGSCQVLLFVFTIIKCTVYCMCHLCKSNIILPIKDKLRNKKIIK